MTDKLITHDTARFYMAFKYLNKQRTFEMLDYIDKNQQLAKDVARYFELDDNFDDGEFNNDFIQSSRLNGEMIFECHIRLDNEYIELKEKLSKVGNKS